MTMCFCACHLDRDSIYELPPDVRSPVDAVTACQTCLNAHTPALVCPEWPIVPPINPQLTPWIDKTEGPE